jgi:hypothetical protein
MPVGLLVGLAVLTARLVAPTGSLIARREVGGDNDQPLATFALAQNASNHATPSVA